MGDTEAVTVGRKVAIRESAVAALKARGFRVLNRASGAGSPPFSQVDLIKGGETERCAIKLTMRPQGRISFTREGGEWKVLRQADLVLHVWHHPEEPDVLRLSMFRSEYVTAAFNENYAAAVKGGFDKIPAWLSPKHEPGARFIGSGFESWAEWTDTIPFSAGDEIAIPPALAPVQPATSKEVGVMARVKLMLAEHMGVPADRIEVDVRVKL